MIFQKRRMYMKSQTDMSKFDGIAKLSLLVLLIASLFGLTGCGIAKRQQAKADFQSQMNGLIGKSSDALILARGVPTSTASLSDGGKVLEYVKSRTETSGGGSYTQTRAIYQPATNSYIYVPVQQNIPIGSETMNCKIIVHVSSENKILSWKSEGNDCY